MTQQQKVIFVTGGSRGVGKAIIDKFHDADWLTVACATNENNFKTSNADLNLVCDIADKNCVKETIKKIISKFGRLDAVVNNAGISGSILFNTEEEDDLWHRVIDVNLHGTYYVSKYSLPHLPNETGRIVNISSVLGLKGVADQAAYCSAKHGVIGLTKSLALHLAKRRITVNAICPGWIRTDMMQNRMQELHASEAGLLSAIPLTRTIEPEEIAEMTWHLVASPATVNMTGQTITIDGGYLA